jgi:hypothetical protein
VFGVPIVRRVVEVNTPQSIEVPNWSIDPDDEIEMPDWGM